ncbi:hypothetical protein EON66_05485, partial [archaeon]
HALRVYPAHTISANTPHTSSCFLWLAPPRAGRDSCDCIAAHVRVAARGGLCACCLLSRCLLGVQGSACIYSRKVEYLYNLIYQALDMVHAQSKTKRVRFACIQCGAVAHYVPTLGHATLRVAHVATFSFRFATLMRLCRRAALPLAKRMQTLPHWRRRQMRSFCCWMMCWLRAAPLTCRNAWRMWRARCTCRSTTTECQAARQRSVKLRLPCWHAHRCQ